MEAVCSGSVRPVAGPSSIVERRRPAASSRRADSHDQKRHGFCRRRQYLRPSSSSFSSTSSFSSSSSSVSSSSSSSSSSSFPCSLLSLSPLSSSRVTRQQSLSLSPWCRHVDFDPVFMRATAAGRGGQRPQLVGMGTEASKSGRAALAPRKRVRSSSFVPNVAETRSPAEGSDVNLSDEENLIQIESVEDSKEESDVDDGEKEEEEEEEEEEEKEEEEEIQSDVEVRGGDGDSVNVKVKSGSSRSEIESAEEGSYREGLPFLFSMSRISSESENLQLYDPLEGAFNKSNYYDDDDRHADGSAYSSIKFDESAPVTVTADRRRTRGTAPLLVFVPGLDGTGKFFRSQVRSFASQGYDLRCVYIPPGNRSNWKELVEQMVSLLRVLATRNDQSGRESDAQGETDEVGEGEAGSYYRHVTLVGESFGACLSLRVALAAPDLVSRLVLMNPGTNFAANNYLAGLLAASGILEGVPYPVYATVQELVLPFMARKSLVSREKNDDIMSIAEYVPAPCAAFRLKLLLDESGVLEDDLRRVSQPTLLIASGKDRILPSLEETGRLKKLLQNSKRAVLPESGHFVLLEEGLDLSDVLKRNGLLVPATNAQTDNDDDDDDIGKLGVKWNRPEPAVPDEVMDELGGLLAPWRFLASPVVSGEENLPNRYMQGNKPILFVGNHTMFGYYDTPLLFHELYLRGYQLRGLAHPGHWLVPQIGDLFARYGNVKATPRAAYNLLKEGECVLLFPGGSRETCKLKGEKYKLLWKERTDFVRMAARFGAIIVPFSSLGGDDAYKILFDRDDILSSPLRTLIDALVERNGLSYEDVHPITAIPGTNIPSLIPIPSVERIYYHFLEPIDTSQFESLVRNPEECHKIYMRVKQSIEDGIEYLQNVREADAEKELGVRLLSKAVRLLPDVNPPRSPFSRI